MGNHAKNVVSVVVFLVCTAGVLLGYAMSREKWSQALTEAREEGVRAGTAACECSEPPEPEPCPSGSPKQLEATLYRAHNILEQAYNGVEDAMDAVRASREAVREMAKTPEEREEEAMWRELYEQGGLEFKE